MGVRCRQLGGARPSLADCVQRHDPYFATRTKAAALRAVFKSGYQEKSGPGAFKGSEASSGAPSSKRQRQGVKSRRSWRKFKQAAEPLSDDTASEVDESDKRPKTHASRCAWPENPRLPDDKIKEFRAECRRVCPESCFAFLVGTCRDAAA